MMPRALLLLLLVPACAEPLGVAPGGPSSRPPLDENDLWGMVPAEADLVLWADMGRLRSSPWTRDGFAKMAAGGQADSDPRFDLIRDVDRVIFAKVPSFREGASVLIAQGKIDREGLSRAFTKDRGEGLLSSYRGAELLRHGDEALAFVGRRTVISGLTIAVRAALDCNFGVARAIETESWFEHLRRELEHGRDQTTMLAAIYIHLLPATREALMREMGEGGSLEDFAGRIDLTAALQATAIGVVRTETEARDLAARLTELLRDARVRPSVEAFGLGRVIESIRLRPEATRVFGELTVSEKDRAEIVRRMAVVADTMAAMRKSQEEKAKP
jgi:hypothetical protein